MALDLKKLPAAEETMKSLLCIALFFTTHAYAQVDAADPGVQAMDLPTQVRIQQIQLRTQEIDNNRARLENSNTAAVLERALEQEKQETRARTISNIEAMTLDEGITAIVGIKDPQLRKEARTALFKKYLLPPSQSIHVTRSQTIRVLEHHLLKENAEERKATIDAILEAKFSFSASDVVNIARGLSSTVRGDEFLLAFAHSKPKPSSGDFKEIYDAMKTHAGRTALNEYMNLTAARTY